VVRLRGCHFRVMGLPRRSPTLSRREQCKNVARHAATGLALHNIVPPRCAGRMYDRKKILCASVPWCVCASSPADARSKSVIGDALF